VSILINLLYVILSVLSVFLIGLVLIQRGRGGGLAGAFGATGGSSAFGTRAGDVFTRITIVVAGVWIGLSMLLVLLANQGRTSVFGVRPEGDATKTERSITPGGRAGESGVEPIALPGESTPKTPAPAAPAPAPTNPDLPPVAPDDAPAPKG
jgi:preprotein translocase subunit SecG